MKRFLAVALILAGVPATGLAATTPSLLNLSGRLATDSGDYSGNMDVTVTFHDDADSSEASHVLGTLQQKVAVEGGRFNLLIQVGDDQPIDPAIFARPDLFVGLAFGDEPEMKPRMRVASVPFAFSAATLDGLGPEAWSRSDHVHDLGSLTGQLTSEQMPGDFVTATSLASTLEGYATVDHDHDARYVNEGQPVSITSAMIAPGTVGPAHLADAGCEAGEVLSWTGAMWACGQGSGGDYGAGLGMLLEGRTFLVDVEAIRSWARDTCYDTTEELAQALTAWDQDAQDDLTTATWFQGDVGGPWDQLVLAQGAVHHGNLDPALELVTVQDPAGATAFVVTPGAPALGFVGEGATSVTFDPLAHQVRIASTDKDSGGDITGVSAGAGLVGGASSGEAVLSVSFGGTGSALSVARSDHEHDARYVNEGQDAAITTAMLASGAVTNDKVASGIDYAKLAGAPSALPPSGTAGGDLAGTYPNPTLRDGAAVRSLNGLTDAVRLLAGTNVTLTPSGQDLTIAATGGIKAVDGTTFFSTTFAAGDLVKVDGTVTLTANDSRLQRDDIRVFGGTYTGPSTATLTLGNRAVVQGAYFKNVQLSGTGVTFLNCRFEGSLTLPNKATYLGCAFSSVTSSSSLGPVISSTIENSTLTRLGDITNSSIQGSTLSDPTAGAGSMARVEGNRFNDVTLYPGSGTVFNGNDCDYCTLIVPGGTGGQLLVNNNIFAEPRSGFSEVIRVEISDDSWRQFQIANNSFAVQGSIARSVLVTGYANGSWRRQVIRIFGNTFQNGVQAVTYDSDVFTMVSQNAMRVTSLGVADGTNIRVLTDNVVF